jgi:hypothetical protein
MRSALDFVRKAAAIILVLASVTTGILGLGLLVDRGSLWGLALMALVPFGIGLALKATPEGGTTGYFDQNI